MIIHERFDEIPDSAEATPTPQLSQSTSERDGDGQDHRQGDADTNDCDSFAGLVAVYPLADASN